MSNIRKILSLVFISCIASIAMAQTPQLSVSPASLFFRQSGNSQKPASQTLAVKATGGTLGAFTVAAATKSGGNWLSVTPASGSGAATLTVSVNTANLASGEYDGTVTVTATGFAKAAVVEVELEINGNPGGGGEGMMTLLVRPSSLKFRAVEGGPAPDSRFLDVMTPAMTTTTSAAWTATATVTTPSGGKWLKVSPASGTGKGSLEVSIDLTGLAKGEYTGQVKVTSGTVSATTTVSLDVDAPKGAKLNIDPKAFNFIVEPNSTQPLATKTLRVKNTGGGTFSWTATASVSSPTGGNWLTITPASGTGEGTITLKANPTGLAEGMYAGLVTVKSGTDSEQAQVFLRILGPSKPNVKVHQKALKFTATAGVVSPATRTINITSSTSGSTFTATATTAKGGNWLTITPAAGAVPGTITVSATAGTLTPGVYTGNVQVKISGAAQEVQNILVTLKILGPSDTPKLELEPGGLSFTAVKGATNPAAKTVRLEPEGIVSLAWTAAATTVSGGNWLSVTPTSGTTTTTANSSLSVSASIATLNAGTYSGTVTITPAASSGIAPVTVGVKLIVSNGPSVESQSANSESAIAAGPLVALFTQPADRFITSSDLPLNVEVTLLDSAGATVEGATVTVSSSRTEPDLVLTDLGGGQYSGVFRTLSSGTLTLAGKAQADPQSAAFTVSGDVESAAGQPTIVFQNGAVSAASFAPSPTPTAPGSLLSVFGLGIAGSGGAATGGSPLPKTLSGVSVTIGGFDAALISATPGSGDQINLQVPFELSGVAQADIVVNNNGVLGLPETINVGVAPALFTVSQSGTGAGAFLHGGDFAAVTSTNRARGGEVILLFATGLGAVSPAAQTGALAKTANVVGNVTVTIGGQAATVQYAGLAPGFAGLYQLNVVVPNGISGDATVVVSVDGVPATGQATVSVQ